MPAEIQTIVLCGSIENVEGGLCDPKQVSVYERGSGQEYRYDLEAVPARREALSL